MKSVLLLPLAAVFLGVFAFNLPASANWFKSSGAALSGENHFRILGSAPGPTQDDLRCVGDSYRPLRDNETCDFNPKSGHYKVRKIEAPKKKEEPAQIDIGSEAAGIAPSQPALNGAALTPQ